MISPLERYLLDAKHHLERGEIGSALAYIRSALDEARRLTNEKP